MISVTKSGFQFEREPLLRPFGFKGGYMRECWQTASMLESKAGTRKVGLCTQNVLWSDARVYTGHSEAGANLLMAAVSEYALKLAGGCSFESPILFLESILEPVHKYAMTITGNPDLKKTFVLNALVGIDNAAWLMYAAEKECPGFDTMLPEVYRPALSCRHDRVAAIPLVSYTVPVSEIVEMVQQGSFFIKIKLGQPGAQQEMLEKDMARLSEIHQAIGHFETPHTANGKLPYYFDANGRYESKESLQRLIDHTKKIGAFDRIALIEEPFPEHLEIDVRDLGVRIAADESAHTDADALARIQMGYGALALKPIAKTLSMTLKIAKLAHEHHVPCFCADLTVNPILVEWNKNVAARLAPLPGLTMGLCESNGHQNYRDWQRMVSYHPYPDAHWRVVNNGLWELDPDFYEVSGGIFSDSRHYTEMFEQE